MTDLSDRYQQLRLLEALVFAAAEPLDRKELARHLPEGTDIDRLMEELANLYANRGVTLERVGDGWAFRTAADLAPLMKIERKVSRKLSRAAMETLAIVAYHQPITRAEIEEIRGVGLSKGTLDTLLEAGWVRPRGRRRTPGRPVTWCTTEGFLDHFGLESRDDLPGVEELKAAGLLDTRPALTALTARGKLGDYMDDDEDSGDEDSIEETDESLEELLAEDFGEDLAEAEGGAEDDDGGQTRGH
ncbi:MAG: SMC-Scp complex subunit ScpB [Rhodovibrionaceae bacterium]|nr:SMC-Scp complex subunit ScpB [Rhodovibrionaceae bacterium]